MVTRYDVPAPMAPAFVRAYGSNERSLTEVVTGGTSDRSPEQATKPLATRGTSNGNARGSSEARRRRRTWLVETYRADVDVQVIELFHGPLLVPVTASQGADGAQPACRCYRCGALLTADTVTVDRIKPGCRGGTYARTNIRPACGPCNSETGGPLRGPLSRKKG
jgi:hypothetical protein